MVQKSWTALGADDPMWAALTDPPRSTGRWNPVSFLQTGRDEIRSVLTLLAERGLEPTRGTALDFGCGPGRLTAALAAEGFERAVGVDVSPTMVAAARALTTDERCQFLLNDRPDLAAVDTASVDFVYSCRVLQHIPPALAHDYIREFLRVARPGAPVVFQLPAGPAPGALGAPVRLLPSPLIVRLRKGMQMHGTPVAVVTRLVAEAGGVTVSVEEDASAGPRWRSYLYLIRRDA